MHNIKMPKNIHLSVYFLKHDILTLKIRFIEPFHEETSDLDFAYSEDSDHPEHPPTDSDQSLHCPHEERYERSFTTH